MKSIALVSLVAAGLLAAGAVAVQDMPAPAPRLEQHEWLQQLVGEWTLKSEMTMAPGESPMSMEGTESVRSIGGLWIQGEMNCSPGGQPMTALLTLGYDPAKEAFVGTWVDTMQAHMWSYLGTLDETGTILTLATQGPSFDDPSQMADYRDAIEIKSPDHKVLTSSVKQADDTWLEFLRVEYRRKP